jgi:NAD(P)-dependent dehydrogenase (short-subunit alcohol dehydrogenase family)
VAGMMEGKVAVVTGAGGGVGREIAIMMARAGAKVIVADIGASLTGEGGSASPAEQTKALIEQRGGAAEICTESVAAWGSAQKIVQAALDHFGRIDAVVNNAGILRDGIFHKMTEDDWLSVISVHLNGSFFRFACGGGTLPQAGKRGVRAYHLDVRPGRQRRASQLCGGEAWDHGPVEVDRTGYGALQRAVELPVAVGLEPDDELDPDLDARAEGGGGEAAAYDAGQERSAGGVSLFGRGEGRDRAGVRDADARADSVQLAASAPHCASGRGLDTRKHRRLCLAGDAVRVHAAGHVGDAVRLGSAVAAFKAR